MAKIEELKKSESRLERELKEIRSLIRAEETRETIARLIARLDEVDENSDEYNKILEEIKSLQEKE